MIRPYCHNLVVDPDYKECFCFSSEYEASGKLERKIKLASGNIEFVLL